MAEADVKKMTDEELIALAEGKKPPLQDISKLSDDELEKIAFGNMDKPKTQPKDGKPAVTMAGIKEATIEQLPMLGTVVGGGLGLTGGPLGAVAGAGGGAAAGKGLQQLIRGYQKEGMDYFLKPSAPTVSGTLNAAGDQAIAALEGATAEMGGQVLTKGLVSGSQKLASKLKDAAEKTSIRAITPTVGQVEKLNRGKGVNKVGRVMIDEKMITPGATAEQIAKNADEVLEKTGKQIGNLYQKAQKQLDGISKTVAIDPEGKSIIDGIKNSGFKPARDAELLKKEFAEELSGEVGGTEALNKLTKYLDEIAANGDDVPVERALEIRRRIDKKIKWGNKTAEDDLVQQGLYKVRDRIQTQIEGQLELMANSGFLDADDALKLKSLNKTYSAAADVADITEKTVARNQAKQVLGLSEKGFGMAGVLGAAATQDPEMLVLGLGAAGASKLSKKYGASLAYRAFDQASKLLAKNPAAKALADENPNYLNFLTDQIAYKMSGGSILPAAGADENNPLQRRLMGR